MKPDIPPIPRPSAPVARWTPPHPRVILLFFLCLFTLTAAAHARSAKRGICYGYHAPTDLAAISPGVSWWYNWALTPESGVADVYQNYAMEFVPMAWKTAASTPRGCEPF